MVQPLESTFEKLLGRTPSPEEREKLFRVKDALGLGDLNSIWLILVALGHYEKLYEDIPLKAEQAAQAAREVADAEIRRINAHSRRIREAARSDLTKIVERNAVLAVLAWLPAFLAVVTASSLALDLTPGRIIIAAGAGLFTTGLSFAITHSALRGRQGAADGTAARRESSARSAGVRNRRTQSQHTTRNK